MTSNPYDVQIPATENEIAEAILVSDHIVADVIRRLAFELDKLRAELITAHCAIISDVNQQRDLAEAKRLLREASREGGMSALEWSRWYVAAKAGGDDE